MLLSGVPSSTPTPGCFFPLKGSVPIGKLAPTVTPPGNRILPNIFPSLLSSYVFD